MSERLRVADVLQLLCQRIANAQAVTRFLCFGESGFQPRHMVGFCCLAGSNGKGIMGACIAGVCGNYCFVMRAGFFDPTSKAARRCEIVTIVDIDRFGTPFQNCRSEWGVRWDMVAYCAKQQIEGYKSLDNIVQGISDDVSQSILRRCTDEWTNDYNMIGYCAKTQSNAWKALNN